MMDKKEAAKLLVEMVTDVRASGYVQEGYHEAVALACAALFKVAEAEHGESESE